jgi:membrane-bound serine protease (ClpP class)
VNRVSICFVIVLAAVAGFAAARPAGAVAPAGGPVYVVPIDGVVDEGMAHYVARAVAEADAAGASALVLDVNTPGGLVSAAFEIRDALLGAHTPTFAYVSERAYSAGALITLATKRIVMAPGSSIGAAEPIPNDPKHVSALRAEFASTAARNHRDPTLAAAMVDKSVDARGFKKSGAILSLTADEAVRAKIADAVEPTLAATLAYEKLPGPLVHANYTFGEQLARFATSPEVSGILLSIGVLGLFIELQTMHGIGGAVGIGALALFFGTHVYAGFSDAAVVALGVAGVVGILLELHVFGGQGIAGALGVLALVTAVVLAFGLSFVYVAIQALAIAIVLSVLLLALSARVFPRSTFMRRVAFSAVQGPEYVASADHGALLGQTGFATSFLRPAGVASVDGKRVDVLTDGDFVPAGSPVRVSRVEGARIFVDRIAKEE